MNKKNVIITIISVLLLVGLFAFARTTTTDLGLVKPTWTENIDILDDINANSDLIEAFANDPLEFDTGERLEDRAGAMWTGNTETGITVTYQDSDNTIDAVIGADDIVESMLKVVNTPNDEEIFTYEATTGDFEWHTLAELSIQPLDGTLTALAGLTIGANELIYGTGADAFSMLSVNAAATNKFLRQISSGVPSWEILASGDIPDISATYLPLSGGTMAGAIAMGTNKITGLGNPTNTQDAVTLSFLESTISFTFDYFFNNTSAGIGATGYFNMTDIDLGGAETTDLETTISSGTDNQELFEFITLSGEPGIEELSAGVYSFHFHAQRTSGNSTIDGIYVKFYKYETDTDEILLATSEISSEITTAKEEFVIHFSIGSEITLDITDRLLIKFFANTGSGGGSGSDVEIYVEGTTSSRFSFQTSSAILSTLFVRQDGTTPLTANWDVGAFDIRAATITADGLTSGRVVFASTNGLLVDDAELTYNPSTDTVFATIFDGSGQADFASLILDTPLIPAEGGTGVANGANNTITFSGNYTLGLTLSANTAVQLPTSGTLAVNNQTFYIGTTQVAINRGSGVLTLAGLTLTSPTITDELTITTTSALLKFNDTNVEIYRSSNAMFLDSYNGFTFTDTQTSLARLKITQGGSVGIGTTSPSGNLDINAVTDADPHILLSENDATKWDIYNDHNDDALQILANTTLRAELNADGRFNVNITPAVTTVTGTDTLTVQEAGIVLVSAGSAYTITLPTASGHTGLRYHFVKTDYNYNLITLDGDGAETFNYENSTGSPNLTYLRLNTPLAGVTIVSDGSNWQVINEAMGQVPMARVYLNANQTNIASVTWTTVEFDEEDYDIGSNFNTTTHLFTAPIAGKYHVIVELAWVSTNILADKLYRIGINENTVNIVQSAISGEQIYNMYDDVKSLAATDTIPIDAYHNTGVNTLGLYGNTANTFAFIRLISKD